MYEISHIKTGLAYYKNALAAYHHGRIIKWTQHIDFLTFAGMELVVEGNHGNDLIEG